MIRSLIHKLQHKDSPTFCHQPGFICCLTAGMQYSTPSNTSFHSWRIPNERPTCISKSACLKKPTCKKGVISDAFLHALVKVMALDTSVRQVVPGAQLIQKGLFPAFHRAVDHSANEPLAQLLDSRCPHFQHALVRVCFFF